MPEILKLFHGSKVVPSVLEAGRFYHDVFGSWVYEATYLPYEDSNNSANLMGGDFSMEMLAPKDPNGPAPSARFLQRHGPHFINIAFWVKDAPGLAKQLLDKGVRIALPGGNTVSEFPAEDFRYFLPHPKDMFGSLLEFIEDNPDFHDPRRAPWWSSDYWSERHPLGVQGLSHCTVAVADLEGATKAYGDYLGCPMIHEEENKEQGTQSRYFAIGDTVIELAHPTSADSDIGRHMAKHGPIVYAFTFKVRDLGKARDHVQSLNLRSIARGDHTFELDPAQAFGAVYGFTVRDIPGRPTV